ncbi:MAG: peptidase S8, partial [Clostridiaceae bacterium]|nr:peptidase S8 [Clostridiaceae bacterium]
MAINKYRHIFLKEAPDTTQFSTPLTGGTKIPIPYKDPSYQSSKLFERFNEAWKSAEDEQAVIQHARNGVYVEFISDPGSQLVTKSLEDMKSKKIRLLNVRTEQMEDETVTFATVYVAHDMKRY